MYTPGKDMLSEIFPLRLSNSFSDIIKASDEDIEWLYSQDAETVIQNWIKDTYKIVLLTKGSEGTSLYRGNQRVEVSARKITVVDTVGAGDTFIANFLGQLDDNNQLGPNLEHTSLEDLTTYTRIAGIAASITCERAGCEPPSLLETKSLN